MHIPTTTHGGEESDRVVLPHPTFTRPEGFPLIFTTYDTLAQRPNSISTSISTKVKSIHALSCQHELHPAYAPVYTRPLCPDCYMQARINDLRLTASYIMSKGGVGQWRHKIEGQREGKSTLLRHWAQVVKGGSLRKNRAPILDAHGRDIGYRCRKVQLLAALREIEYLADEEKRWRDGSDFVPAAKDTRNSGNSLQRSTAMDSIKTFQEADNLGQLDWIEQDCLEFSWKRGWWWARAADGKFPDESSEPRKYLFSRVTIEQRGFIKRASTPSIEENEFTRVYTAPRNRRNHSVRNVTFDKVVRVRSNSDVDGLRRATALTDRIALENKQIAHARYHEQAISFLPSRKQSFWSRHPSYERYRVPGTWAAAEGVEFVDTSGCTRTWLAWDASTLQD